MLSRWSSSTRSPLQVRLRFRSFFFHSSLGTDDGRIRAGLVEPPWRMAKTLRQLGNNFGRLRTLDLTAWDNLTAQVLREIPPTVVELDLSMTTITPQGKKPSPFDQEHACASSKKDPNYHSFSLAAGIAALPSHIQSLNLHYANISSRAITYLNHLTSLRKLNLSRCNGVIAACIQVRKSIVFVGVLHDCLIVLPCVQYLPNAIEELDVSFCPNLHFEKKREKTNAETFIKTAFSMSQGIMSLPRKGIPMISSCWLT